MASQFNQIYFDSCVIIDALEKSDKIHGGDEYPRWHYIKPILEYAKSNKIEIVVSVVCKAEALVVRNEERSKSERMIDEFFEQRYVHVYGVSENTANRARDLRRIYKLGTADAIHVATAQESKTRILISTDGDGKKDNGTILSLKGEDLNPELTVVTPREYFSSYLDDVAKQTDIGELEYEHEKESTKSE